MEKEFKDMTLGEIVSLMINLAINSNNRLNALDGAGSPYHSEEELREGIIRDYHTKIRPFIDELNEREISYSK